MSKILNIGVEQDHLDSLTKATGISALSELIWNSLDADATEIKINYKKNAVGNYEYIKISDNGHGLDYNQAQYVFSKLGGSIKKIKQQSPKGRSFHGKEGKGRYKSLALGDLIVFKSIYKEKDQYKYFEVTIDRNHLSHSEISDVKTLRKGEGTTGFIVEIYNTNTEKAEQALIIKNRKELEIKFASYWINYQNFKIYFQDDELKFTSLIKNTFEDKILVEIEDKENYNFIIKIIEWKFDNNKKTYLCNRKGIPFRELSLGIRSSIPISVFIQSEYIEKLHKNNNLNVAELDEIVQGIVNQSKKIARKYIKDRLHLYSKEFIEELKREKIYPYQGEAKDIIENSTRQVFDIVALQVNEFLPSFTEQSKSSKKLTFSLIKEALEKGSDNLTKILSDVIDLPKDKQDELADILETTSLSNVIDTMTEIKNRLKFLNGLEQIIYDKDVSKNVLERKHLHKIIIKETWIFGDEYTYGADDMTLQNVLKAYLKELGRENFEEVVKSEDNSELKTIPDVCLWQQYSLGSLGKENLVIELKKPTVDAGFKEASQIQGYASKISNDNRFPKKDTKWKCILITRNIKDELEPQLRQKGRKYGHLIEGENFDVFILSWGTIINEAKKRHEYIRDKLNLSIKNNEEGLNYLKDKYKEYLPDEL